MARGVDLKHIKTALAVLDTNSFTKAARRLGYTYVHYASDEVRTLEAELGFRLFERTSWSRITATETGRQFLDEVRPLLAAFDQVVEKARSSSSSGAQT